MDTRNGVILNFNEGVVWEHSGEKWNKTLNVCYGRNVSQSKKELWMYIIAPEQAQSQSPAIAGHYAPTAPPAFAIFPAASVKVEFLLILPPASDSRQVHS